MRRLYGLQFMNNEVSVNPLPVHRTRLADEPVVAGSQEAMKLVIDGDVLRVERRTGFVLTPVVRVVRRDRMDADAVVAGADRQNGLFVEDPLIKMKKKT